MWFTIATPPGTNVKTEVDKFSTLPGVQSTRMLPTIQMFKIGVKLDMNENKKLRSLIREMIKLSDVPEIKSNYENIVNRGMDKLVAEFTHRSGKLAQNALSLMREIESRKRIFSCQR